MAGPYKLGQVIELNDGRVATIRFIGDTSFSTGEWIGVEFEDESGKNDGSVQGERYFDCAPGHGMFLRDTGVSRIVEEPKPKPAPAPAQPPSKQTGATAQKRMSLAGGGAATAVSGAGTKSRPTSMIANGTGGVTGFKRPTSIDPMAAKRQSINAASPTPGARGLAQGLTNGTKSPSKPTTATSRTATAANSTASSRGATPPVSSAAAARKVPPSKTSTAATSRTSATAGTAATSRASATRASATSSTAGAARTAPRPSIGAAGSATTRPRSTTTTTSARGAAAAALSANRLSRTSMAGATAKPASTAPNGVNRMQKRDQNRNSAASQDEQHDSDSSKENRNEEQAADTDAEDDSTEKMNGHAKPPQGISSAKKSATNLSSTSKTTPRVSTASAASNKKVQELEMKLETMEKRHAEDKEKLMTLERLQAERDRFEGIIQRLQTKYQPQQQELNDIRKHLKEKEERLTQLENAQSEHDTSLEMATLDREMAEETAEMLRSELDALKQRMEELDLEVEVLRDENTELGKEMSPEERTSQGWMQMERSNERLREALLRLRDMTQSQEAELKDHIAGLEEDLKALDGIKEQYDETKEKLKSSEAAIEDLRQQLDSALGADDMIEELTDKNLALTEHVGDLQLAIEDLENLKELNDELELNHVETEKQMQDELDYKDVVLTEASKRSAQQDQQIAEHEYTINKFRDLVTSLQSHIDDMRASQQFTEAEAEQLNARSKAMMDLNVQLQNAAAKAQTKTIDLELRRLEAQEAAEHLIIVQLFLPEGFKSERDSVLAYLRFKRVAFKSRLLHGFLKEKLSGKEALKAPETVFITCDVMDKLMWVSTLCDRFVGDISGCSLEQFARYEGSLYELEPVEKGLNRYIDAWRRDELKEKNMADELQRSIALLTHLAEVHIQVDLESYADDVLMRTTMMLSHLEHSANALMFIKMILEHRPEPNRQPPQPVDPSLTAEQSELTEQSEPVSEAEATEDNNNNNSSESLVYQYVQQLENLISQTRSARVVAGKSLTVVQELKERSMAMDMDTEEAFEQTRTATSNLAAFCQEIGQQFRSKIDEHDNAEEDMIDTTIVDLFLGALGKVRETAFADPREPNILNTLNSTVRITSQQLSHLLALTNDLSRAVEFTPSPSPWTLRSEALKESTLTNISTEEELNRLKDTLQERLTQLRLRDQTLEEQAVKIELLESRMKDANAKANKITELQTTLEQSKKREKELATVLDRQIRDAQELQVDRDRWKQVADDSKTFDESEDERDAAAVDTTSLSPAKNRSGTTTGQRRRRKGERAVATAREMDALRMEIKDLQGAVRFLRLDNTRFRYYDNDPAQVNAKAAHMAWLAQPLLPKEDSQEKDRRERLAQEGNVVLDSFKDFIVSAKCVDFSTLPQNKLAWRPVREKSAWITARQAEDWYAWKDMEMSWLSRSREYLNSRSHHHHDHHHNH